MTLSTTTEPGAQHDSGVPPSLLLGATFKSSPLGQKIVRNAYGWGPAGEGARC